MTLGKRKAVVCSAVLVMALLVMALALGGCGRKSSSYEQITLDEASGIRVTAENAGTDQTATTADAITVNEGDGIMISPFTQQGSFHLTITSADGKTSVYDDDVSGQVLFMIDAAPGTYNVTTCGNNTTGWMTVFSRNKADEAKLNADLQTELEKNTSS